MRLRKIQGADEAVESSEFVIHNSKENKENWNRVFGNDNPIRLEIGMGKGRFITELSKRNPDANYLGMERFTSVLLRALEKREADEDKNPNLYFLYDDAEELTDIFGEGEIDEIYLNFSDPWPKARHAKRRLTSSSYLEKYEKVLKKGGKIVFKTDNRDLFDFSVEEIGNAGWELPFITNDLHKSEKAEENIMTEYEVKFSKLGNRISELIAIRPER